MSQIGEEVLYQVFESYGFVEEINMHGKLVLI